MKILVTGGAGFIASHLVDELIKQNHEVIIIDNLVTGFKENINPKAKFYEVDIVDSKKIKEIFKKEQPEIVNHHAAHVSVVESTQDPLYNAKNNILGSLNVLTNSRKNNVKKLIFISTGGAIYGDVKKEGLPIKETYVPKPISPYAVSKLVTEQYLFQENYVYGLNYITLRYANVFGPRQDLHGEAGVNAIFLEKMLRNEPCTIFGNGLKTRDYIYIKDIINANILATNSNFNGPINIGSGIETTDQEVFDTCKKAANYQKEPIYEKVREGEAMHSCIDITLAKEILNWQPKYNYKQGINETVGFYRKKLNYHS